MFATKNDFVPLARRVALSSRQAAAAAASANAESITPFFVDVYQVRLWKLLRTPEKADVDAIQQTFQCNPQDLLHTIVALYDKSLSEIGGETIYNTICEPKVVTVLVVLDESQISIKQNTVTPVVTNEEDCLDTLLENVEYPDSVFHTVFSDASSSDSSNEDEEENGSDDDDEHDYSVGIGQYLEKIKAGTINIHKRLIACASFQKITLFPLPTQEEHVLDLQLMACRKKFRGRGIGRHLIKLLMNRDYMGPYDAIITAADQEAIDFYRKFGFNEDAILSSKYKDIGDSWTNTTKMCYLPPYNVVNDDPIRCLTAMDDQFQKWQKSMFNSYQNQAALFNRLKNEMIGLYAKISAQEQTIVSLNRDRHLLTKENAALKLKLSQSAFDHHSQWKSDDEEQDEEPTEQRADLETRQMIQEMEKISILNEKMLVAQMSLLMDDDCNTQMALNFCSSKLIDASKYKMKAKKVTLDAATIALYQSALGSLHNGNQTNETLLFYFGHNDHLDIIADAGFTAEDCVYGSFGKGLYFQTTISHYLNDQQKCDKMYKVLLCKVALGRVELIRKPKKTASTITLKRNLDFDSIKILDLEMKEDEIDDINNEIVIFDAHLALPLFIVTFE